MSHHRFATGLSAVALLVLVAGCAGPNAGLYESDTGAAGPAPASELSGAWHGTFGWVGANFYEDEARIILRIEEDGTFSATVTLVHRLSSKDIDRGLAGPGALDDVDAFARWRLSRRAGRGRWHASPTVRAARSMLPPRGPARWEWFRSRQHDR